MVFVFAAIVEVFFSSVLSERLAGARDEVSACVTEGVSVLSASLSLC